MAKATYFRQSSRFNRDPAVYVDTTDDHRDADGGSKRGPQRRNNVSEQLLEKFRAQKRRLSRAETGFQAELYAGLSAAYAVAEELRDHKQTWLDFTNDPFWNLCSRKKPSPTDDHREILLWLLRYLFDVTSTSGPRYNRVHKYASTLRRFAKEGVLPEDIEKQLEAKGTEYAFTGADDDDPEADQESESDFDASHENHPAEASPSKKRMVSQSRMAAISPQSRGGPRTALAKPKFVLFVEVNKDQMSDVLTKQRGSIDYEHRAGVVPGGEAGWQRVVAIGAIGNDD